MIILHYLENLITLLVVSIYFNNETLLRRATKKLRKQLNEQILDDGGHYECSPMYHVILLSRLLVVYRLIQCNQLEATIKQPLANAISRMQGWLNAFCFKNGSYAMFNDASNNIAVTTKTLNSVFEKTGLKAIQTTVKESGYRKFSNNNFEVIIDVSNIIPSFQPGHAHSDMLSFCLNFKEKEIFIDPGVSTYEENEQRLKERGTAYHNTVTINNENQSNLWASFRVARRASLSLEKDELNHCKAEHDGYFQKHGVTISREFQLHKNCLEITDRIIGNKEQEAVAHFFIHPEINANKTGNESLNLGNGLKVLFTKCTSLRIIISFIPDGYNKLVPTQMIEVIFHEKLVTQIIADL